MPSYVVRLSVCPSGVTLMYADHISRAMLKVITRLISTVSQLFACLTSANCCEGNTLKFGRNVGRVGQIGHFQPGVSRRISETVRDGANIM